MAELPTDILTVNRKLIEEFRRTGMPERPTMLLLTTTGRRTGIPRTSPLMYVRDAGRLLVIASNKGAVADPQWIATWSPIPGRT